MKPARYINAMKDNKTLIAQCDDAAWPVVKTALYHGALLVRDECLPRYVLFDRTASFGPSLSAGYVKNLLDTGVLQPALGRKGRYILSDRCRD